MTKTIVQQITDDRLAALGQIRIASGYRFDALPKKTPATTVTPVHGLILLSVGSLSPVTERSYGRESYTQAYSASATVTLSEYATDTDPDDARAILSAEIWRALCVDRTCNGLAIDIAFEGDDPIDSEGSGIVAVTVSFSVEFWTLDSDPFNQQ
jgi:hypothetical protein